jgi:S-DNA-T family DNA segregation ATPase FtsK/SpoIIIE
MVIMQIQQPVIESTYFDVTDFNAVSKKLLQIKDGTFGFERQISNGKIVNRVIAPFYIKNELQQSDSKIPIFDEKSQENTHFYHVLLKNNDLFPIFLSNYNCLFDDLYLENEQDKIILQLLVKYDSSNWQEKAIDQNDCYLSGVDNPSKSKFGQLLQTKVISFLDKVSNQSSEHDANKLIENKILEQGYLCELRIIVQSNDPIPTIHYIQDILNHYTHLNSLIIYEDKQPFNLTDFSLSSDSFHLSESEVISLIHTPVQQSVSVPTIQSTNPIPQEDKIEDIPVISQNDLQRALRQVGIFSPNQKLNHSNNQIGNNMQLISMAIPKGKTFTQFVKQTDNISAALGRDISIVKGKDPNTLTFLLPLEHRKIIYLDTLINSPKFKQYAQSHPLPLAIGLNLYDKPVFEDLTESPHMLIAGATLSGKSVFLNSIITTLLKVKKQNELQISIVDPKMVEFNEYKNHPNVEVITDMQKANQKLKSLIDEMERRYLLMSTHHVKNIKEYNLNYAPVPYIVCVIDEYYDLYLQDNNVENSIARLGQKARAAGIHLIVATQRPDKDVLTGVIKTNLTSKISFHLGNNNEYKTVFGKGIPFNNLMGNGDGVMNWITEADEFIRFQAPVVRESNDNANQVQTPLEKLKSLIGNTGETRIKELQKMMGIRINDVSNLMKQLVGERLLVKTNRGYEIVEDEKEEDVQD